MQGLFLHNTVLNNYVRHSYAQLRKHFVHFCSTFIFELKDLLTNLSSLKMEQINESVHSINVCQTVFMKIFNRKIQHLFAPVCIDAHVQVPDKCSKSLVCFCRKLKFFPTLIHLHCTKITMDR